MSRLVLFNKPYDVLSQFTDAEGRSTLTDYITLKDVYPAGRLDRDSEGLLLLTDDGALAHQLTHPKKDTWKTYWIQVEGNPDEADLQPLRDGVTLKDGPARPAKARLIDTPELWPRTPPVRFRKSVPDRWIEICIQEGRNRQIRRMTAAIGFPTLRLVRVAVGEWQLGDLPPGQFKVVQLALPKSSSAKVSRPQRRKRR